MTPNRYHSLDNLRAVLMLLGILLHAACSYVTFPLGGVWPYKDAQASHPVFDYVITFIHVFRMPLFFVLAGFFARLLFERRGLEVLVRNRFRRIVVPLVVGWSVLYIPTSMGFEYGMTQPGPDRLSAAWRAIALRDSMMHLWFLNYLVWFYAGTVVAVWLVPRVAPGLQQPAQRLFRSVAATPLRALALAVPTVSALWFMKTGALDTSTKLIPEQHTLVAYAIFYLFGWMLYNEADLLERFPRFAWTQTVLGFLLVPVTLSALIKAGLPPIAKNTPEQLTAIVSGGLAVCLLISGLTGLFIKYVRNTSQTMNYLADASYWMYLVHLPVVIWLHVLLEGWNVSSLVKYPVVVAVTVTLLIISYKYLVRNTVIGEYLNGTASKPRTAKAAALTAGASA